MSKPTHGLFQAIVDFVLQDGKIQGSLEARNKDPYTVAQETRCLFQQRHPTDPNRALYEVQFIFHTNDPRRENNDDISVRVEVNDGATPDFAIRKVVLS